MTKNILAILYLIAFLFSAAEISAYKVDTHAEISEEAFNVSVLKGGYLNNLWLTETEKLKGKDIGEWIIEGSKREDDFISCKRHDLVTRHKNVKQSLIAEILAEGKRNGEFDVQDIVTTAEIILKATVFSEAPCF